MEQERSDFRKIYRLSTEEIIGRIGYLQSVYEKAVMQVEHDAANAAFREELLDLQRSLYTELEHLFSLCKEDRRHHILIVIPVADRPVMLKNCLASIVEQCRLFQYGGSEMNGSGLAVYQKIKVFILDDSRDKKSITQIRESASRTSAEGVETHYIGIMEQTDFLKQMPEELEDRMSMLLGNPGDRFLPHKGPSITRNIAYLYLHSIVHGFRDKALVYFIDSDEEFRINIPFCDRTEQIPFINYFYWLDRIFSSGKVEVLTGKVVGDPPVSPSVMINTFLGDLISFLENISGSDPHDDCVFHHLRSSEEFSAEYHDMGTLFGYKELIRPQPYQCSLSSPHALLDCFRDFSEKAIGFFYGQHPTRSQFYNHAGAFIRTGPARTVYTGNYVFNEKGFRHFIPFAGLKLRMAGPALGRILRARIGNRFVSANLPLLHRRTIPAQNTNEYRSGLVKNRGFLDLSEEFCRQFWGDVMLFSVDSLAATGYPGKPMDQKEISDAVMRVQNSMFGLYGDHQARASAKIAAIKSCLADPALWWNHDAAAKTAVGNFRQFCTLAEQNFGTNSLSMKHISEQIRQGSRTAMISDAIHAFSDDEHTWDRLLKAVSAASPRSANKN